VISNFTVSFNASQSYSTVAILNYTWNFGDGNVTTLAGDLVDHTFATNSTYAVTLTLGSSASNNSAVVFHDVVVGLEAPSTDDTGFYIAGGFFFAIVILVIAIALSKR
jgi:PKD repeat protein